MFWSGKNNHIALMINNKLARIFFVIRQSFQYKDEQVPFNVVIYNSG